MPTDPTSIASKSSLDTSRHSNFFTAHSSWSKLPATKKISLGERGYGCVTRDFLKIMAKKGLFTRFFGEGVLFWGHGIKLNIAKKSFRKNTHAKKVHFFESFREIIPRYDSYHMSQFIKYLRNATTAHVYYTVVYSIRGDSVYNV